MSGRPRAFERFQATRRRTLELTGGLTQDQIDFSPGPELWSLGEVMDHLIQVDRVFREEFDELLRRSREQGGGPVTLFRGLSDAGFSLPMVPDAFLRLFDVPAALAGILVPRMVRQAVFGNRKVPAKAPRRIVPEKGRPARELERELAEFDAYLRDLVSENPGVDWDRLRYYNPLTGLTNLPGVLSFTASHERRHQGQIREILASEDFPTAAREPRIFP